MHTLIIFLAWYIYFKHVPSEESDQCVYRSCPFYWSICTKPGKWSVCVSIHTLITFLDWYIYSNKKCMIDTHTDHFFIEVHVPSQESDQCVYQSCPFYWSICTKPGKWSVCASILPFLLKHMYQARIKRARSIYTLITFLVWYMYFNKKRQDQYTHWSLSWLGTCTSMKRAKSIYTLITFLAFVEVHVPSQESDQCVYRSCPFNWSTCTKPGKWSLCASILPFVLKYITFLAWYMYFNKKVKIDTHTDHFPGLVHILTCTKPGKWSVCVSILHFLLKYMYQARKMISVCIDLVLFIEVHVPTRLVHVLQ
jgi:hypothetical protein